MRRIKIVGLAMGMALALTAFAGASSAVASETTLCKVKESPCKPGSKHPSGTAIKAGLGQGGYVNLVLPLGATVKCSELTMSGELTKNPGEPAQSAISGLTLGSCSNGCQFSTLNLPYKGEFTTTDPAAGNGTLKIKQGSIWGNPGFRADSSCVPGTIETGCTYTAEAINVIVTGGSPGRLDITGAVLGGSSCPSITMKVMPESGPTGICPAQGCAAPYSPGTSIAAGGTATFSSALKSSVTCESSLSGTITQNPAKEPGKKVEGEFTSATFTGCSSSCQASSANLPWKFYVESNGAMWLENGTTTTPGVAMKNCTGVQSLFNGCTMKVSETQPGGVSGQALKLSIAGGAPATAAVVNAKLASPCAPATLNASYTFSSPSPLWVSNQVNSALQFESPSSLFME